jgi:hypothetical protein
VQRKNYLAIFRNTKTKELIMIFARPQNKYIPAICIKKVHKYGCKNLRRCNTSWQPPLSKRATPQRTPIRLISKRGKWVVGMSNLGDEQFRNDLEVKFNYADLVVRKLRSADVFRKKI